MPSQLKFGVPSGPPREKVDAFSQFGQEKVTFDGLIFGKVDEFGGSLVTSVNALDANTTFNIGIGTDKRRDYLSDDINANNLGFGIVGTNPNQASQINNNEGFVARMEDADNFHFGIQGIGNNAAGVQVKYWAYDDKNHDGKFTADELVKSDTADICGLASGNHVEYVHIDPTREGDNIDAVFVQFYYDAAKGDLSSNNKNALAVGGVRVTDFYIETENTLPDYTFQVHVGRTDNDEEPIGTSTGDSAAGSFNIRVTPELLLT